MAPDDVLSLQLFARLEELLLNLGENISGLRGIIAAGVDIASLPTIELPQPASPLSIPVPPSAQEIAAALAPLLVPVDGGPPIDLKGLETKFDELAKALRERPGKIVAGGPGVLKIASADGRRIGDLDADGGLNAHITNSLTASVTGTVGLDSASLAALETIGLDSTTLSALEHTSVTPETIVVDANNTTTATLTAGSTYTGTATNILGYEQVNVQIFGRPGVVAGDGTSAQGTFFFEFSPDGTNWDTSVPHLIRDPSLVIPIPIINVHKFFRVRYVNDGGVAAIAALGLTDTAGTPTAQTAFRLTTYLLPFATKELTRTLDQSISGTDPAALVRAAIMGQNPDSTRVNKRVGGKSSANSSTANLASGASFTGSWVPVDDYASITVLVNSNLDSATNGIDLQFSSDGGTTIHDHTQFSYLTSAGGQVFVADVSASYFRLVYTNKTGSGTTSSLNIETRFYEVELSPSGIPLNQRVNRLTTSGSPVRADIIPLPTWQTTTQVIGATSVQLTCSVSPLSQRKSLSIHAYPSNSGTVTICSTATATLTGGRNLDNGSFWDIDLADVDDNGNNVLITAIASAAGQRISMTEIA